VLHLSGQATRRESDAPSEPEIPHASRNLWSAHSILQGKSRIKPGLS
jgi:hypothetical protein